MTIREMITEALKENGFDGLYYPDMECGCFSGDLMPCENPDWDQCIGGFKHINADGYWIIGPKVEDDIESGS